MTLLGDRNWWAPAPVRRVHQRFGLHEAPSTPPGLPVVPTQRQPGQRLTPAS
jgi:putative drug exporter of the RND superfamily